VDLASLIETIQLDHVAAHALDSYLRHAIAISLQSHAWFSAHSDGVLGVVLWWSID